MTSTTLSLVRYITGHSDMGDTIVAVTLVGYPTHLTVNQIIDPKPVFSVPWANFQAAQDGIFTKEGMASLGAFILRALPITNILGAADPYYTGVWMVWWDEEIQRKQRVFFDTSSERNARRLVQQIYQFRDSYQRTISAAAKPEQRVPPPVKSLTPITKQSKPLPAKKPKKIAKPRKPAAKSTSKSKTTTARKGTKKK